MAYTTSSPTQPAQRATLSRRPRPSTRRRAQLAEMLRQQRGSVENEPAAPDRPTMRWVLVTDENGRTRPEARWNA